MVKDLTMKGPIVRVAIDVLNIADALKIAEADGRFIVWDSY